VLVKFVDASATAASFLTTIFVVRFW